MKQQKKETWRLLQALGQAEEGYLAEAAAPAVERRGGGRRLLRGLAAACLCLALAGSAAVWLRPAPGSLPQQQESPGSGSSGQNSPGGGAAQGEQNAPEEGPIRYDALQFPEGRLCREAADLSKHAAAAADIVPFDEELLSGCCAILEGTVTDIYVKRYAYDTWDDKFDSGGVLHHQSSAVVYALEVETVWYGQGFSGTVLVEDTCLFPGESFTLQVGRRYVVPLYEGEDTLTVLGRYAGGGITRDSRYGTVYPYHPQIQITTDGAYVVPGDWPTLTEGARAIEPGAGQEDEWFGEGLYLVGGEAFARQMALLVSAWLPAASG